jgi:uncharacterized membrane-anchored protein
MQLKTHPRFAESYKGLHSRAFFPIKGPVQVSHIAVLHEGEYQADDALAHLQILCQQYQLEAELRAPFVSLQFPDFELRWEQHTEFSTYSFITYIPTDLPFADNLLERLPQGWVENIPGQVVSAVRVGVVDVDQVPDREVLRTHFEGQRLKGSELRQGAATLWSSLQLHEDGFNRMLVLNQHLSECEIGRIVRALLELEAYRNMLLLALPVAQETIAAVSEMEDQLAVLTRQFSHNQESINDQQLLSELSTMAAAIAELIASSRYRFDAAKAYYQMVESRFEELQESEVDHLQTISDFIDRRLSPAIRTVRAAKRRLDDLSGRVGRATDFIRTRIDMSIEKQNQNLLKSMDRRAKMQFRLQQTVESLSVVVLTFYVLSLLSLGLQGIPTAGLGLSTDTIVALMIPLVLGVVWYLTRRVKKKITRRE